MNRNKKHKLFTPLPIRLIFSNRCRLCMKVIETDKTVCSDCDFEKLRISEEEIRTKVYLNKTFDNHTSPFYYDGEIRHCIHLFKYRGFKRASEFLSEEMIKVIERDFAQEQPDYITFVPMTKKRLKERDYNHGEKLAKHISKAFGMKTCQKLILKVKDTPTQVTLGHKERLNNLKGAFKANPKYDLRGKCILICDDVLTTGSTLSECSKALKKAGAARVICVTASANDKQHSERRASQCSAQT